MGIWRWLTENSFNLLSAIGIIGGLWFTAISFRTDAKMRRVANLISITGSHREIWRQFLNSPDMGRVFDSKADILKQPITQKEEVFVNMVIAHINTVFYAIRNDMLISNEGLRRDVSEFLSLPIPRSVWEKSKVVQNDDFAAFVESCRNWK
jgi:hypothetical protein